MARTASGPNASRNQQAGTSDAAAGRGGRGSRGTGTGSGAAAAPGPVLDRAAIAEEYGYALKVIYSNKEIRDLFEQAVNPTTGVWASEKFLAALRNTDWWRNNSESARLAWAAERMGTNPDGTLTADWQETLDRAGDDFDAAAAAAGAVIDPTERADWVRRYIYEGWATPERKGLMGDALAERIADGAAGNLMGAAGDLEEQLRAIARNNGLNLSDDYFRGAAKSVASRLTTADDWMRDVRTQAASLWPTLGDKILAGSDASDLGSGYVRTMAQTLELDESLIDINDPMIRKAMAGVDDKGNPKQVGLWDFQNMLRQDPRWMNTKQATDSISSIATDVMRMFGLTG